MLVKNALGLRRSCHSTPLLNALHIQSIQASRDILAMKTLKSAMLSSSHASDFYCYMLNLHWSEQSLDPKGLLYRVVSLCAKFSMSLCRFIVDKSFSLAFMKSFTCDGITDSCQQLLEFYSRDNQRLLNLLLSSY